MKSTPPSADAHDLGGLHRGLAEVAGDQLGAVDLDQLALREQPERAVDAGDQPGDGGLAGAGVAVEDQVPGDRRRGQAGVAAQPLDPQHRGLAVDLGLHVGQADQVVELGEQLLDGLARALGLRLAAPAAAGSVGAAPGSPTGRRSRDRRSSGAVLGVRGARLARPASLRCTTRELLDQRRGDLVADGRHVGARDRGLPSWAAAAVAALPVARGSGVAEEAAARATSPSAAAYAGACARARLTDSVLMVGVGAER